MKRRYPCDLPSDAFNPDGWLDGITKSIVLGLDPGETITAEQATDIANEIVVEAQGAATMVAAWSLVYTGDVGVKKINGEWSFRSTKDDGKPARKARRKGRAK